jgi:hypothetical protein
MRNAFNQAPRARAVVAVFSLICAQACYNYVPLAATAAPRVGGRARALLTPEGTRELARYLGPNVVAAEGGVSSAESDGTLVLAVDFVQTTNGIRQPWTGEGVVSFPAAYRSGVSERTLMKKQSMVAGAVLAAALVATAVIALKSGGASTSGDGGTGQPPP